MKSLRERLERILESLFVVAAFAACAWFAAGAAAGLVTAIVVAATLVWQTKSQEAFAGTQQNGAAAPLERRTGHS